VGAIGALLAGLVGVLLNRLTWDGTMEALRLTVRVTAMIFLIIAGAKIFGYYMTLSQVPQALMKLVGEWQLNRWVVIAGIVVGYFLISMFMDEIPLLLITLSLTFPLVTSLGFDPVWFGVLSILMVAMGLVFPPVGMVAFVVSATANVKLTKVYKGTSILVIALIITTILVCIFPEIALWLPSRMQ
jgi:TRAP-type C4-dicarboxylate transport system permease large subunit